MCCYNNHFKASLSCGMCILYVNMHEWNVCVVIVWILVYHVGC